jgi:hexulose-6-phosphate isomerase
MTRREFAASAVTALQTPAGRWEKGICATIFPSAMQVEDYFSAARDAGFTGVEMALGQNVPMDAAPDKLARIADAAAKARCSIVSLWLSGPLSQNSLNSPDPEKRARGVEAVKRGVDLCAALGCQAMLLVPGRLGSGGHLDVGYEDTWKRVTESLRIALPHAAERKVCITPENVWNKFLVSPLEMRAFVDQFSSPWLQTQFDTGNIMQYGFPQDWINTLGARIRRVHLKDYKLSARAEQGRFVPLLEGDVDWKETMAALIRSGYRGFLSPEYSWDASQPDQIRKISAAVDKILAMA